ncbi:MAG: GNAT family N-acetyltransferase [Anaerolineaceae bacterium]|nr:MAG: GNAT family N-acetyltransferase [Anaerolineaceae bacterium]
MIGLDLQVRPAGVQDRQAISNLIFFQNHAHRHLDWHPPLDWLGSPYFWLIEENGRALAVLACPPDPPGVAWVRLFAYGGTVSAMDAWSALWGLARVEIQRLGGAQVGVIALHGWMRELMHHTDFDWIQNIVMLEWRGRPALPPSLPEGLLLRPMKESDLPAVGQVDTDAFDPLWRISLDSLRRAFSQSISAAVIESSGGLLGYQLSTGKPDGCHLARLAVRKEAQGFGLGAALVGDLIRQMRRRGAGLITVNTQNDNRSSMALYQKMGFARTGEEYSVFRYQVNQGG